MAWLDEFIYKWRANSYKGRGKARNDKNASFPFSFDSELLDELEDLLEELTGGISNRFENNKKPETEYRNRERGNSKPVKRKTNTRSKKIMDMMMDEAIEKMRKR